MVQKRAPESWEAKLANCEVAPQTIWPIAKSLKKSGGPKVPSAIHGPIFYPKDKANMTENCLENQFRSHDLCDCDHRQYVSAQVGALLAAVTGDNPVKF
jgi:hypothetical protein